MDTNDSFFGKAEGWPGHINPVCYIRVVDYKPLCIVFFKYGVSDECFEWYFTENDVVKLIEIIDSNIDRNNKTESKQERKDRLFH